MICKTKFHSTHRLVKLRGKQGWMSILKLLLWGNLFFRSVWELIKLKIDPFLSHLYVSFCWCREILNQKLFSCAKPTKISFHLNSWTWKCRWKIFSFTTDISTFLFVNFLYYIYWKHRGKYLNTHMMRDIHNFLHFHISFILCLLCMCFKKWREIWKRLWNSANNKNRNFHLPFMNDVVI